MSSLSAAARAAALAALLTLLLPVAVARAASYTVRSCDNGSTSGWTGNPSARVSSTCRAGGGGSLHARVEGAPEEGAGWRFAAPRDTDLQGFTITRSFWRNGGVAFGTPLYRLQTYGAGRGYFRSFANFSPVPLIEPPGTERAAGLTGQTGLEVAVLCGGGGSCRTPAATLDVTAATLVLRDAYAPSIERVSGSLLSDGPLTGIRALRYTAADRGGGVARAELTLDGVPVAAQVADVNGGACAPELGEFAAAVPCRPRATNTLTFDTRVLADGPHAVRLRVYDATAVNHADWTARVAVDNVPPPANRELPAIAGEAREGETLTASPGTWSGTNPAFAYHWQRYDAGWRDVPGATSPTYVPDAGDIGHRLRVRVTATDAEGSGVAYSPSTERVLPDSGADDGGGDGPGDEGDRDPVPAPGPPAAVPAPGATGAPAPPSLEIVAGLGSGRRGNLTVPYGRAVAVRGTVRDATGAPARRVALSLLAAVDGRWRLAGATWSGADGRFSVLAGPGPSRRLVVTAGAVRSRPLRLAVRAAVRLRPARQGRFTLVRGELLGGHVPAGGVLVTIQARRGRRWVAVTTLVSNRRGRFHGRLAGARLLRAAVARQPGYPFAAGTSPRR